MEGLIHGGAFSEFYGIANRHVLKLSTGPIMVGTAASDERRKLIKTFETTKFRTSAS